MGSPLFNIMRTCAFSVQRQSYRNGETLPLATQNFPLFALRIGRAPGCLDSIRTVWGVARRTSSSENWQPGGNPQEQSCGVTHMAKHLIQREVPSYCAIIAFPTDYPTNISPYHHL